MYTSHFSACTNEVELVEPTLLEIKYCSRCEKNILLIIIWKTDKSAVETQTRENNFP